MYDVIRGPNARRTMAYLRWQNLVDFVVLALALYLLLRWSQEARAIRLGVAMVALRVAALVSERFHLVITPWVIDGVLAAAIVVLLVLFQPELRHALARLDVFGARPPTERLTAFEAISTALFSLAAARRGALVVVARRDAVDEVTSGGLPLGGVVSAEILEAIFRKTSPVHDGAAIIVGNRVTKVGVVLPLSRRTDVSRTYGTRHRAAMGLAEQSDAVVLVASEERGEVTVMHGDRIAQMHTPEELKADLVAEVADSTRRRVTWAQWLGAHLGLKLAALGLAALVWTVVFVLGSPATRVRTVPLVFLGLPANLTISRQSTVAVEAELQGKEWQLNSADLNDLVAAVDVHVTRPGRYALAVGTEAFRLPDGIHLESVAPARVTIDVEPATK